MSCAARSDRPLYARNQPFSWVKTDMALIRRCDFHLENEIPQAFRGTRSALGATFEAADKYGRTLVHPVSANPNPSGIVTGDAFEQIAGMILEAADTKGRPGRSKRQIFSVKLALRQEKSWKGEWNVT